jgi:hypothetical protein
MSQIICGIALRRADVFQGQLRIIGGHLGLGFASSVAAEDVLNRDARATESETDHEYSQTLAQFKVNQALIHI